MTVGTHGSTFGGNPLAMSAANAVLDVMLEARLPRAGAADGTFLQAAPGGNQRPLSGDHIPRCRGEGLLVGVRAGPPAGELVEALRAEKMIAVAAGDNVVRLLPPLIISEPEIAEGIVRLDRACGRLLRAQEAALQGKGGAMTAIRHF